MAKCLVTGGAGFVGSHVVDALIEQGHDVWTLDNYSTGKQENRNIKAYDIHGDINNSFMYPNDMDYVFHLAALARIQPSIEDPQKSNYTNLNGTLSVLEYCRRTGAKIIFSGSSSIYEGELLPIKETDPKKPKSPYAMQKLMCEQYIRLYHDLYGLDYAILRYFNVYGERQLLDGAYAAVVGILLEAKKNGKKLPITNDGNQTRDFTYVKDVANANVMAMNWNGTFNIGSGKNYSINELADAIGGQFEYIGNRKGEARNTLANNDKARANGWKPTMDIIDWIHKVKD